MTTASDAVVSGDPASKEFIWPVRVYYEDTDAAGVVYHSNYLKYMERARTEWLRALGYSQQALRQEEGILFVVKQMAIRFVQAAGFDEQLTVKTTINSMNAASLDFTQTIVNSAGGTVASADVVIACLDEASFKPRRIPKSIKEQLTYVD